MSLQEETPDRALTLSRPPNPSCEDVESRLLPAGGKWGVTMNSMACTATSDLQPQNCEEDTSAFARAPGSAVFCQAAQAE